MKGKRCFPNANKFSAKRELAMKWLHNIGMGHTVEKFNFNWKMVCQDHVTIDLEHMLLGLGERRLLKLPSTVLSLLNLCTERKVRGRRVGVVMAREERSRKRDEHNVCKYYKWDTIISFNVFPL